MAEDMMEEHQQHRPRCRSRLIVAASAIVFFAWAANATAADWRGSFNVVSSRTSAAAGFSFQAAYDNASDGAVVQVPAGVLAVDSPGRDAATVFGDSGKRVTFVCADPNGKVTQTAGWFTIKAFNVTVRGDCFHFNSVFVGEPGDDGVTAQNVTLDGVHMQGLEIVGAKQVTVKNSEIGPNVMCYAQGSSQPAAMKCDPNGPPYEAMWAARGSDQYPFQPFIHNNSGGIRSSVVMDNNYVHDIQTKDADRLHTGCGLVWQPSGGKAPLGEVTIRNSRYERCAVLGILFSATDGVVLENNWMGPPVEPLSNPNGGQVAGDFAKEITARDIEGYDRTRNWRVTGNTFCHGTRAGQPAENVVFENNDLGVADAPWTGATYTGNRNVGASCASSPPPPAACANGKDDDSDGLVDFPADKGCASAADTDETDPSPPPVCTGSGGTSPLPLTKLSETNTTITLGWTPVPGAIGYRFVTSASPSKYSTTNDPFRSSVKFSKIAAGGCYWVLTQMPGAGGGFGS